MPQRVCIRVCACGTCRCLDVCVSTHLYPLESMWLCACMCAWNPGGYVSACMCVYFLMFVHVFLCRFQATSNTVMPHLHQKRAPSCATILLFGA